MNFEYFVIAQFDIQLFCVITINSPTIHMIVRTYSCVNSKNRHRILHGLRLSKPVITANYLGIITDEYQRDDSSTFSIFNLSARKSNDLPPIEIKLTLTTGN